ncbi:STAS/SEC14 domain-containing protein [Persicobacter sp. CCB-QB2]|uniref:STAS/SEC14 domain-containing protein n=1 Tax=Persicobacter sp. CCB-QB2 TaxID=1561025 RepID=UPI0006A9463D|nr:STAS/SEC14 domain-containing protein [Persicobacter sp. CCB-QB2]
MQITPNKLKKDSTNEPNCFFDKEQNLVRAIYVGFLSSEEFQNIGLKTIETLKSTNTTRLLVDTERLKVLRAENQDWIKHEWFPKALSTKLTKMAFIEPDNPFGKASAQAANTVEEIVGKITINYFKSEAEALNWLNQ